MGMLLNLSKMRVPKIISLFILIAFLLLQQTFNTGCTKPQDTPTTDTIIVPPPPTPIDTVSLVRRLDELTSLYPSYTIILNKSYSFYYDNLKRVTSIGIKIYPLFTYDSFTVRFDYSGTGKLPYRAIIPYINGFSTPVPSQDTVWFYYNTEGRLQKDSSFERYFSGPDRTPAYRLYTYPDTLTAKVDWYWPSSVTQAPILKRRDTVRLNATGLPDFIKAVYPTDPVTAIGSYAKAEAFTYSQVINPLSKLNISGSHFSFLYTNVKNELLGNSTHPLVYNSNGSATYLDFISLYLPTQFYITGYNSLHQVLGQGGASFPVEITPWTTRPTYPSEIRVRISTSLSGDRYLYRYYY
jgi:hypothetical protein